MRRAYKKHKVAPDQVYNDVAIAQFINKVMKGGKKNNCSENCLWRF